MMTYRLNSLFLLCFERELIESLDYNELISEFDIKHHHPPAVIIKTNIL